MAEAMLTVSLTQLAVLLEKEIRKEWRLVGGVKKDVLKLTTTLKDISAVLVDADKRQVKEESVKLWLEKLRDVAYETDDILNDWNSAILKLQIQQLYNSADTDNNNKDWFCPFFTFSRVTRRRDIGLRIKSINKTLHEINIEKIEHKFNHSSYEEPKRVRAAAFINIPDVYGRVVEKDTLVRKLCETVSDRVVHIISVVGLGGMGKTTLAQWVFNNTQVINNFEKMIWVSVSDPFDEVRVAKAIVEAVELNAPHVFELQTALELVKKCILGKKFFLVLDDVWSEDFKRWSPLFSSLNNGAFGSKILVTTRSERVSKKMRISVTDTIYLGQLSPQDCWDLFSQIAFSGRNTNEREELEAIGKKISEKCKGLPLAANAIGSLMCLKNTKKDWQAVLDSEIWELEVAETELFPPLLLSYYELPSAAIKRCFSYCANFPKDYKIESDSLIKIWMAQGYLSTKDGNICEEMEITGQEYLKELIMRSFFQDLEKDKDGETVIRFKMHDMVHDLAQYLTKNESAVMDAGSEKKKKFRHLTLVRGEDTPFPVPPENNNTKDLHTFWVQSFYDSQPIVSEIDKVPVALFDRMKYLKVLDLSRNRLLELPKEVEKLMNLRYLNLSHNPLTELPSTVCDLCNLQTLKLSACDHLRKLPQGLDKLINLRHLEIDRTDDLRILPKGIRSLTTLRTLSKFVICGTGDISGACTLGDLENLDNLRGCLKIEGLGFVEDASEAQNAKLMNKEHIVDLQIDFSHLGSPIGTTDVFDALKLPTNLQFLQVKLYGGTRFPSWMVSLTNLRSLRLQDCQNCKILPPLGKLPLLETLNIESMDSLKLVGHEFFETSSSVIAFPKLKKLKIVKMKSWEEWSVRDGVITVMPCLRYLKLSHCEKLQQLPDPLLQVASLKKLRIHNCPILQQRYQKGVGEDWKKVSHIPKSRISRK